MTATDHIGEYGVCEGCPGITQTCMYGVRCISARKNKKKKAKQAKQSGTAKVVKSAKEGKQHKKKAKKEGKKKMNSEQEAKHQDAIYRSLKQKKTRTERTKCCFKRGIMGVENSATTHD